MSIENHEKLASMLSRETKKQVTAYARLHDLDPEKFLLDCCKGVTRRFKDGDEIQSADLTFEAKPRSYATVEHGGETYETDVAGIERLVGEVIVRTEGKVVPFLISLRFITHPFWQSPTYRSDKPEQERRKERNRVNRLVTARDSLRKLMAEIGADVPTESQLAKIDKLTDRLRMALLVAGREQVASRERSRTA